MVSPVSTAKKRINDSSENSFVFLALALSRKRLYYFTAIISLLFTMLFALSSAEHRSIAVICPDDRGWQMTLAKHHYITATGCWAHTRWSTYKRLASGCVCHTALAGDLAALLGLPEGVDIGFAPRMKNLKNKNLKICAFDLAGSCI